MYTIFLLVSLSAHSIWLRF